MKSPVTSSMRPTEMIVVAFDHVPGDIDQDFMGLTPEQAVDLLREYRVVVSRQEILKGGKMSLPEGGTVRWERD